LRYNPDGKRNKCNAQGNEIKNLPVPAKVALGGSVEKITQVWVGNGFNSFFENPANVVFAGNAERAIEIDHTVGSSLASLNMKYEIR